MQRRSLFLSTILLLPAAAVGQGLHDNIRNGNLAAVKSMLESGADPNSRSETGVPALMTAAAFASTELMRFLIDAGADVNATNRHGSTALMWAAGDLEKVQLLLKRGANVNATNQDGGTASLAAALQERADVLKVLLDAGADPTSEMLLFPQGTGMLKIQAGLVQIAYATSDPHVRNLLSKAGLGPAGAGKLAAPGQSPLQSVLLNHSMAARRMGGNGSADTVRSILALGGSPEGDIRQMTTLASTVARAAAQGDLAAVRLLIERGADVNRKGNNGLTPLLAAAATDPPSPETVRYLLENGADPKARDSAGKTALDWALQQGETETSILLRAAGSETSAPPPTAAPVDRPRSVRAAVEAALEKLQIGYAGFSKNAFGCISCHHQSLPVIAVKIAGSRGVNSEGPIGTQATPATLKSWAVAKEPFLLGNCAIPGFLGNAGYGLFAMAVEGAPPNEMTDAVAACIGSMQRSDGGWFGGDVRPPLLARSDIIYTALAARALKSYMPRGRRETTAVQIGAARQYLLKAKPNGVQEQVFRLLGLLWTGASRGSIASAARDLMRIQRAGGGWAQRPTMQPDAYATGQALYALEASGLSVSSGAYRRGVSYLLRTQLPDGTWHLRSRGLAFQPYFDTGFPHGKDQFISSAATAWAAIALAYAL